MVTEATRLIMVIILKCMKKSNQGKFPGGPVVRTPRFHCRCLGSVPGGGTILQATWCDKKQTKKIKSLCCVPETNVVL